MVDPHTSRFWQETEQTGLITAAKLEACWAAIPEDKRTADAIDRRLAREAVEAGHLTLWQAQQVLAGRAAALRIDKYLLIDLIGQGGMGRVYLGRDTRLNRKIALKILSRDRMNNPRAVARFQREAQVGAQLQHENLVRIYDEGVSQGTRYLVMEYIEGKNVAQILAEGGPMPSATAGKIARQIALGLQHAHDKGLIHRDVNPQNILVTRDGTAKLTDLGLALDLGDMEEMVTRDGATVGTFDYIAPEQARHSRAVDTRSDIYSLGCTLYHMISGQVPFPGPSLPEKLYAHQISEPEELSLLVPGLPAGLDDVVRRMMKKAMEQRYQSPGEVAQALEPYVTGATSLSQIIPSSLARIPTTGPMAGSSSSQSQPSVTPGEEAAPFAPAASPVQPIPASTVSEPGPSWFPGAAAAPEASGMAWLSSEAAVANPELPWMPAESEPEAGGLAWRPTDPDPEFSVSTDGPEDEVGSVSLGLDLPQTPGLKGDRSRAGSRQWILVGLALAAAFLVVASLATLARWVVRTQSNARAKAIIAAETPKIETISAPIAIRYGDGSMVEETDFQEAMNRAADHGAVVLSGPGSIPLPPKTLAVPSGRVTIRAAEGQRPTLDAKMPAQGPLFRANSGCSLTLSGLQIAVEPAVTPKGEPAPLIDCGGNLTLENCIIWCKRPARDSSAVQAQGNVTSLTGCLFQDFDRPVILHAFRGARVKLRHCMMVYTKAEDNAPRSAVKIRFEASRSESPSPLVLDHCTVAVGEGSLFDVEGIQGADPFAFQVNQTIVRAGALLLWKPPPSAFPKAMSWSGEGNRYDVRKPYWIVLPPTGLDGLPNGPIDQDSWEKVEGVKEQDLQAITAQWANPAASASGIPDPSNFVFAGLGAEVGADPKQVGPHAAPDKTAKK